MTNITIDNIDDDLMRRLREQAERTGNSVADEVKTLLNLIVAHSGEKPDQREVYRKYQLDISRSPDLPEEVPTPGVDFDLALLINDLAKRLDLDVHDIASDLVRHVLHGVGIEFDLLSPAPAPEPLSLEGIRKAQVTIDELDDDTLWGWLCAASERGFTERELMAAIMLNTLEREPELQPDKMVRKVFGPERCVGLELLPREAATLN